MRPLAYWFALAVLAGCAVSPGPLRVDSPGTDAPVAMDTHGLDAPRPDAPVPPSCLGPTRTGEATYYTFADGTGNCGFAASTDYVAALNDPDWMGSGLCDTCAEVTGPSGTVTLRIVDRCPECASGDLDLSPGSR
jgi:expansin (peptidoglycan-binding protein)